MSPSEIPSGFPSASPTNVPSHAPTNKPSLEPSAQPSKSGPIERGDEEVTIVVQYDLYPYEVRWSLLQMPNEVVVFNTNFDQFWTGNELVSTDVTHLAAGDYVLRIEDNSVEQDGLCCDHGNGWVQVKDRQTGLVLRDFNPGTFTASIDLAFSLGSPP